MYMPHVGQKSYVSSYVTMYSGGNTCEFCGSVYKPQKFEWVLKGYTEGGTGHYACIIKTFIH